MTSKSDKVENFTIIELNDGATVEGIITEIDKKNSKIALKDVKKTGTDKKEEKFANFELNRMDIKEIKLLERISSPNSEEIQNINAIPEDKKVESGNNEKAYDKNKDFFDNLKPMTNPEAKEESKNYNQKNKDTFNLTENDKEEGEGGFWKRGRGRGGRGNRGWQNRGGRGNRGGYNYNRGGRGGYNNSGNNRGGYHYYNNNGGGNNNDYQRNNNNGGNRGGYQGGYQGYQQGGYQGQGYRGRGRGRGNNRGRGGYKNNNYGFNNRGGFYQNNNNMNNSNQNNQNNNLPNGQGNNEANVPKPVVEEAKK